MDGTLDWYALGVVLGVGIAAGAAAAGAVRQPAWIVAAVLGAVGAIVLALTLLPTWTIAASRRRPCRRRSSAPSSWRRFPCSATWRSRRRPPSERGSTAVPTRGMQASGSSPRTDLSDLDRRKLVLVVIDGLTPGALEQGLAAGRVPALAALAEAGWTEVGTSVFPSLTPVCLTSIATGAYPDVHHIPHLVWYHRGEERVIEYGSSFPAMRAVGAYRATRSWG
jgi:hypothetical protein